MKKSVELLFLLPLAVLIVLVIFIYLAGDLPDLIRSGPPSSIEAEAGASLPANPMSGPTAAPQTPVNPSIPGISPTHTREYTLTPAFTYTPAPPVTATGTDTHGREEIEQGLIIGAEIVRAIERYSVDQGRYPAALTDLIPGYLGGLPVTSSGQPYIYRLFDAGHPMASEVYWLTFRSAGVENAGCTYLRRLDYWDCAVSRP
jgi:hypothetical protein